MVTINDIFNDEESCHATMHNRTAYLIPINNIFIYINIYIYIYLQSLLRFTTTPTQIQRSLKHLEQSPFTATTTHIQLS